MQPVGASGRWKRNQMKARRGTNMRFLPLDWPSSQNETTHSGSSQGESAVLASTLLLAAGLLVILVMAVLIVFSVYYRPANSNSKKNRNSNSWDPTTGSTATEQDDEDESTPMKALNNNKRAATFGSIKTGSCDEKTDPAFEFGETLRWTNHRQKICTHYAPPLNPPQYKGPSAQPI